MTRRFVPATLILSLASFRAALMRPALALLAALGLASFGLACSPPPPPASAADAPRSLSAEGDAVQVSDRRRAPELVGGSAWLNTDRPLSLEALRGHVVVLDFWTYCCINCLHVLPELARLERTYADAPVVVVGVHSGKFDAEKDPDRIRAAMQRHGVQHPVVVDGDFSIWRRYGVEAWPTTVVIDPEGRIAVMDRGEPAEGALETVVARLLDEGRQQGTLTDDRIAIETPALPPTGPLAFPGKVAVAPAGDRIAVADSGHHRVVVADVTGQVQAVYGSGIAGSIDGSAEAAAFRYPQGLAFGPDGRHLYVADTQNHQLRRIDLERRVVTTIAGTGDKGTRRRGGPGREVSLRSPWALALRGQHLFVAMAGAHQIWRWHLEDGTIEPFAGTGRERIEDGALGEAAFSQPSGLALDGDQLYVADSEVSAVRRIDLTRGEVHTLVGTGLFDFGDRDGVGETARLQHALGVAVRGDQLYVADTFNNKLKRLDPAQRALTTVVGENRDGDDDGGDASEGTARVDLAEPGGLAVLPDGRLLIADTNHHRLVTFDPVVGALTPLSMTGLEAPLARGLVLDRRQRPADGRDDPGPTMVHAEGRLGPGRNTLVIHLEAPPGGKLTEKAPLVVEVAGRGGLRFETSRIRAPLRPEVLPLELPLEVAPGATGTAAVELNYFWCTVGDAGACVPVRAALEVTFDTSGTTPGRAEIRYRPPR
ncbi:MAG: thioredoxin-like domain-containing protein [Myxococcota bacterium]